MVKMLRVCAVIDCTNYTRDARCDEHRRASSHARGYDREHRRARADYEHILQRGGSITCWRCGRPITLGDEWDLGHDDTDRTVTRGPEHARECNRAAAGRASHRVG